MAHQSKGKCIENSVILSKVIRGDVPLSCTAVHQMQDVGCYGGGSRTACLT